ncbi:MAG: ribulose-phosphate 3-epimerase [Ekhidna sp.]|nr:ribulose-phosphate 3-epimerase [Ekhidna sp.]
MSKRLIAASVLSADFAHLHRDVEMLNESETDYIHIDMMDGVFVPNISFGFPVCDAIYRHARKPMDFHLMIKDSNPYLERCIHSGAAIITVHYETCDHLHRTVTRIKALGAKAGVAVNPHLPVDHLNDVLPFVDLVLLMSVNPGFGGQKFIETTYQRVARLKENAGAVNPGLLIEVDGGVTDQNAGKLFESGADILVAGNFIFNAENPRYAISNLKKA